MTMINRVVFDNEIYYKVKDLTELYTTATLYKIKKEIKTQGIETTVLEGYLSHNVHF